MRITALLALVALTTPLAAQDFTWRGRIAQGDMIEIRGINGDVRAELATGNEVVVTAVKRARRSDVDEVEIRVVEHDGGVTICAVYPSDRGRRNECHRGGGGGHNNVRDNDVHVSFTVHVPAGVVFSGHTVNGDVDVRRLESTVYAGTVNGSIEIETTGFAEANTVNGSIRARMGRTDWTGELEFHTVNGGITLEVPDGFGAELDARTVNGSFETDFPLTVSGRFNRRRFRGVIGDGGRGLELSTVNGSIRILRR